MCEHHDGWKSPLYNSRVRGIPLECFFQVKSCLCFQLDYDLLVCLNVLFSLQVTVFQTSLCLVYRHGTTALKNDNLKIVFLYLIAELLSSRILGSIIAAILSENHLPDQ